MIENKKAGHGLALLTELMWGFTFISTKVLLEGFQAIEVLFLRFAIAFIILFLFYPKRMKRMSVRQELMFAAAGLFGVCLYFLLENIALTYTMASNVGVIVAVAPFFTAIVGRFFDPTGEKNHKSFYIGFVVAMCGIFLISFNGAELHLSPKGDLLALLAALTWAFYSNCIKKIGTYGCDTICVTRRVFFYGLILMLPALILMDFSPDWQRMISQPKYIGNLLFLGCGASALGFVTWNLAVRIIGAVRTSVYIYLGPIITVTASAVILKEPITIISACGTILTLVGLILSESPSFLSGRKHPKG